jgi:hypothetical protein
MLPIAINQQRRINQGAQSITNAVNFVIHGPLFGYLAPEQLALGFGLQTRLGVQLRHQFSAIAAADVLGHHLVTLAPLSILLHLI